MDKLRIAIYFEGSDGQSWAPEGPGWYLAVTSGDPPELFEIVPRVRLKPDEVEKIAKVLDNFSQGKPLNWSGGLRRVDMSIHDAVTQVNKTGKEAVQRAVEAARTAASRLAALQERVKEFPDE